MAEPRAAEKVFTDAVMRLFFYEHESKRRRHTQSNNKCYLA
jgi:hypothetical protein